MKRLLATVLLVVAGCSGAAAAPGRPPSEVEQLSLPAVEQRQLDADLLLELRRDPHHYFRYLAGEFVSRECHVASRGPLVNLHGDAHVEQYLVTSLGRGLGDFDEATTGPVEIDLVRLATSLRIAGRMRSWDARALWNRFLEGYVAALSDPSTRAPEPSFVARTRSGFHRDHARLLAWCDTLFEPIGDDEQARVEVALTRYVDSLLERRPDLERESFTIVRVGRHGLGVGSRHLTNYLIRARGPTDAPEDDLILEAKAVSTNPDATCLPTANRADPLRILVADARLAYAPYQDVGAVDIDGQPYWIHEWVDDYVEVELEDDTLDETQMSELIYDMGVQLGLGHPRGISEPYGAELRRELVTFVGNEGESTWATSGQLFRATWAGWRELEW